MNTATTQVVDLIGCANTVIAQARQRIQSYEKKATDATNATPACVTTLVQSELIQPHEQEKVATILKDHSKTIALLQKLAQLHLETTRVAPIGGTPAALDKKASAPNSSLRESDRNLFNAMGITV
jgi:hypothetical protein